MLMICNNKSVFSFSFEMIKILTHHCAYHFIIHIITLIPIIAFLKASVHTKMKIFLILNIVL